MELKGGYAKAAGDKTALFKKIIVQLFSVMSDSFWFILLTMSDHILDEKLIEL